MLTIISSLVAIGLISLVAKFLHWYFTKARRIIQLTSDIKSPARHWLWGSLHLVPDDPEKYLDWYAEMFESGGGISVVWFGPFLPWVAISRPDLAKAILRTDEPKVNGVPGYGVFDDWIGRGLVMSKGDIWKRNRRLLTPAFHFDMLKSYLKVFNETNDTFAQVLGSLAEKGESFDIFGRTSLLSLDTTLKCVFSVHDDVQNIGDSHPVVRLSEEAQAIAMDRYFAFWQWPDLLFYMLPSGRRFKSVCKEYNQITGGIITKRKVELQENVGSRKRKDFLDMLLMARDEDGQGLTDKEIRNEVNTFLFAGQDTTSSTLSWTLHALATHQEEQEACRAEIREILKGRDTDHITWEDLAKMNHLTMCIKETLRYNATIPVISRELTRDVQVGEHTLPKGCLVDIFLYFTNRDPEAWEKPHEFNPQRFSQDGTAGREAFSFVPFSAGPRNCIGQNFAMTMLKVSLARILNRFVVTYDASHPVRKRPDSVMKAIGGLWLQFNKV